jgi:fumarate hydratase class II
MSDVRVESDSMGSIEVPSDHYWGAQTERSLHHFAISRETMPPAVITAFGVLKLASAKVNNDLGKLSDEKASLIERAASEVVADRFGDADQYERQRGDFESRDRVGGRRHRLENADSPKR